MTVNTSARRRRDTIGASAANQALVRRLVPHRADLSAQHRILIPEHQHLGRYRPVAAEQHDDQAEYPAGQHVDDLEQHPLSQPITAASLPTPVQVNHYRVFERYTFP